jgi:hypothetical protein
MVRPGDVPMLDQALSRVPLDPSGAKVGEKVKLWLLRGEWVLAGPGQSAYRCHLPWDSPEHQGLWKGTLSGHFAPGYGTG